jgi:hypothetical protein
MMFERDPEEIGPESYEDTELRMDVRESVHEFDPDEEGRCQGYLIRHGMQGNRCNSTQRYSVFHIDDRQWCCSLSEQGIDCGHGEMDYDYPDEPPVVLNHYTVVLQLDLMSTANPYKWDWLLLLDLARSEGEDVRVLGIVPS